MPTEPALESESRLLTGEPKPLLIDIDEAAALLGFSSRYLYDLAARREVPHLKIGRYLRFRRESLEAWAEATEIAATRSGR